MGEGGSLFEFDLGNLMATSSFPLTTNTTPSIEHMCLERATSSMQALAEQIFKLPGRLDGIGRVVELPPPVYMLPRQKALPASRPPTRWEKFAQEKGIQKPKRSVKVWDEGQQEWRRRYGYNRAGDIGDVPIIEASPNEQVGEDPFSALRVKQSQNLKDSHIKQLGNIKRAHKHGGKDATPTTLRLAAVLPQHGKGRPKKGLDLREDVSKLADIQMPMKDIELHKAGAATASMGKFDKQLKGKKLGEQHIRKKREELAPVAGSQGEKTKIAGMVEKILREKSDDIFDIDVAVSNMTKGKKKNSGLKGHKPKVNVSSRPGKQAKFKGKLGKNEVKRRTK